MMHAQSPAYIETPQILLPVTDRTKTSGWFIPYKQKILYTLLLAPNNSTTDLSYTRFG